MKIERKGDDAFQNVTKANETESKKWKKKNSFLKIQKKKKKAGNEIADFQNATNANEKSRKKEMRKIVFENTKKSGNEVAAFQNATNICGRSYCCTL